MISEVSRDTEDCSNDAENSALRRRNKLHFKIVSILIFQNITDLTVFLIKYAQPW